MKKYLSPQGTIYYSGTPLTINDGTHLWSGVPNEEKLLELGYTEYIEPAPDPRIVRMNEIKSELASLDYLTSKYVDGEDMSEYGDWQARRRALREEYRQLEQINEN